MMVSSINDIRNLSENEKPGQAIRAIADSAISPRLMSAYDPSDSIINSSSEEPSIHKALAFVSAPIFDIRDSISLTCFINNNSICFLRRQTKKTEPGHERFKLGK